MENHKIAISRGGKQYVFPSDIVIIATSNPCPCGNFPNLSRCTCSPSQRSAYRKKLSRPLLERFDMILWVEQVDYEDFKESYDDSEIIQHRIEYGRQQQMKRYEGEDFHYNSRIPTHKIEEVCRMDQETEQFVQQIFTQKELSMREFHHMLKVARTIADLEGKSEITIQHVAEAASYYTREADRL
jgi:magnesium chelatase family protein